MPGGPPEGAGGWTWDEVVTRLKDLATSQRLVQRTREAFAGWWANEDMSDFQFTLEEVRTKFQRQSVFFANRYLKYPYITTTLDLYVGRHQVGDYTLVTLLDGEIDDDYLVIYPEFQEGGTKVPLLVAQRQPVEETRRRADRNPE